MKLTSDIHVVGGGYYGFSISGRLDCHVYVINSGTELAIVDPGCCIDRDFEKIISNIRDDGLDPKKIKKAHHVRSDDFPPDIRYLPGT